MIPGIMGLSVVTILLGNLWKTAPRSIKKKSQAKIHNIADPHSSTLPVENILPFPVNENVSAQTKPQMSETYKGCLCSALYLWASSINCIAWTSNGLLLK